MSYTHKFTNGDIIIHKDRSLTHHDNPPAMLLYRILDVNYRVQPVEGVAGVAPIFSMPINFVDSEWISIDTPYELRRGGKKINKTRTKRLHKLTRKMR